jgi:hypothetical protein
MVKRLFLLLGAAALLSQPLFSQPAPAPVSRVITYKWDLDSATEQFAVLDANETQVNVTVSTSGSSTTVTGTSAFGAIAVNSMLHFNGPNSGSDLFTRGTSAKASASSITVDSAITLAAADLFTYSYRNLTVGTGNRDGAFSVRGLDRYTIDVNLLQVNATGGVAFRTLCRTMTPDAAWEQVDPALTPPATTPTYYTFTAAGHYAYSSNLPMSECRVGAKIVTADDGGDLTTNQEQISIGMEGWK